MRMTLGGTLLLYPTFVEGIQRASNRGYTLTPGKVPVTPNNTLRYILSEPTKQLTIELIEKPCIGNCRYYFRPAKKMMLKSIEECHDRYIEIKAFQTIIDVCFYKLLLYGETGQNWQKMMQYSLVTQCLRKLIHEQAYVIESRYILEFFILPRLSVLRINVTNSMMTSQFHNQFNRRISVQMDVANNVQISAKEWMYIDFRDIAFDILNTLLNAKRLKLNLIRDEKLQERLFVFSNLGEMNVAQRKATYRVGIISIIVEDDSSHISHDIFGSG